MEGVLKTRVVGADIRIEPDSGTLVVLCIREAKAVDQQTGKVIRSSTAQTFKRIPTKITEHTDVPRLADEILEKFSCVNPQRKQELLDCLISLQRVSMGLQPDSRLVFHKPSADSTSSPSLEKQPQTIQATTMIQSGSSKMSQLSDYIEMLYEDDDRKLIGARRIMDLARVNENLEVLAQDKLLLGLLARVLKEDASKSIDLASVVISTVLCFSNFALFRDVLLQQSMHEACLTVVINELRRRTVWENDIKQSSDPEQETKRYKRMRTKQDELIALSLHVLMNVCGDPTENHSLSQSLIQRGLLTALVKSLDNEGDYSLLIVTTFLKNLSVFHEVVISLSQENIMTKLAPQLDKASVQLKEITLRLLSNLSLDFSMQKHILASGILPKIIALLANMDLQSIALKVLLSLSSVPENRPLFISNNPPQIGSILFQLLSKWPGDRVGENPMKLASNLSQIEEIAQQIIGGSEGFSILLDRATRTLDPSLFRMLRTIVLHRSCRKLFESKAEDLVSIATRSKSRELLSDVLGILSNLSSGVDWLQIFTKYSFLDFLIKIIGRKDGSNDDMALEAVSLIGTAAGSDRKVAVLVSREEFVSEIIALISRLRSQQENGEAFASRAAYTAYRLLLFKDSRNVFLTQKFVLTLLEWYSTSKNRAAKKIIDVCLEIISECNKELSEIIKMRKFEAYNYAWISAIRGNEVSRLHYEAPTPDEDEENPAETPAVSSTSSPQTQNTAISNDNNFEFAAPKPRRRGDLSPTKNGSRTSSPAVVVAVSTTPNPPKQTQSPSISKRHSIPIPKQKQAQQSSTNDSDLTVQDM